MRRNPSGDCRAADVEKLQRQESNLTASGAFVLPGSRQLTYDGLDRLIQARDLPSGDLQSFGLDSLGNRVLTADPAHPCTPDSTDHDPNNE